MKENGAIFGIERLIRAEQDARNGGSRYFEHRGWYANGVPCGPTLEEASVLLEKQKSIITRFKELNRKINKRTTGVNRVEGGA